MVRAAPHSAVAFRIATLGWAVLAWLALLLPVGIPAAALARTLAVGPDHVLKVPSQAATVAADGDRVTIDPGTYNDCAVWTASDLTIEATGPGVVLRDKVCAGKGIFVTLGVRITIRGLTFQGARNASHNAAGIRAFGDDLTVEHSTFVDNENGILAAGSRAGILRVTDSTFRGNGACVGPCAHALYAGTPLRLLDVQRCRFSDTRSGHHVKSRALTTIVAHSTLEDGAEGASSYLIELPNGGNGLIMDNDLEKGPHSENPDVAISIGVEGVSNPTGVLIVQDNRFRNDMAGSVRFVRNSTSTPAQLRGNRLTGPVQPLDGPGSVRP
jgi:hypothetical protein